MHLVTSSLRGAPRFFHRCFSTTSSEILKYHKLVQSSDRDRLKHIFETCLPKAEPFHKFLPLKEEPTPQHLVRALNRIERTISMPIQEIGHQFQNVDAIHFERNWTYVNLPYSQKTQGWSDRVALQDLIRKKFKHLFQEGDLAIIPGCADGQIAIEVYGNSLIHETEVSVVAADYNVPAMKLGYLTMKSFHLNTDRIRWIRADVTQPAFFQWIHQNYSSELRRHKIATLIQPCLKEEGLVAFLKNGAKTSRESLTPTTVIMPVLLEDPSSEWYQDCADLVELHLKKAEKDQDAPQLVWNKTLFGREMLRLSSDKMSYVPQQYFVNPQMLPKIRDQLGYEDASQDLFPNADPNNYENPDDSRRIAQGKASRIFCIWKARADSTS